MIAQKLTNNRIAIGNSAPRKDAIEVIEDLRAGEFCRLFKCAREWNESINDSRDIVFTYYENEHSKVCKEFDKIVERRRLFNSRFLCASVIPGDVPSLIASDVIQNKEEKKEIKPANTSYISNIKGTSRLLRIPKKEIIKIVRRKGSNDDKNRFNSVCIPNNLREEFFHDVKLTYHFSNSKTYEIINIEEDKDFYKKWDEIITKIYNEGLNKCLETMNSAKN